MVIIIRNVRVNGRMDGVCGGASWDTAIHVEGGAPLDKVTGEKWIPVSQSVAATEPRIQAVERTSSFGRVSLMLLSPLRVRIRCRGKRRLGDQKDWE